MKIVAALLALFTVCQPALTQPKPKAEKQLSANVRIYEPQNMTLSRAGQVAAFVQSLLSGVSVAWSDVPHAIVIRSDNPANLDTAEALLKRFDVPEPKVPDPVTDPVDCNVYLIRASIAPGPIAKAVPPELQSAIEELKRSFSYDHYSLWDTQVIHPGGGEGDFQGILPVESNGELYLYSMAYKGYSYSYPSKAMGIRDFLFAVKKGDIESHIKTSVTLHEGQKMVLGKIRLMPAEHADVFVILALKPR